MKKHLAVISRRESVLRFFSNEAQHGGLTYLCSTSWTKEMGSCDFFVVDTDTVDVILPTDTPKHYLLISEHHPSVLEYQEKSKVCLLSWPSSMKEVNRFFQRIKLLCQASEVSDVASEVKVQRDACEDWMVVGKDSVRFHATDIYLTETERALLVSLCRANGAPVSRESLSARLGGENSNKVDVYICHLRTKLEKPFSVRVIETVRRKGYRITVGCLIVNDAAETTAKENL